MSVLFVNIGEDRATVSRAVRERGYSAPVLLDEREQTVQAYGIRATPTVVIVGRDGTVRWRALGSRPWAGIEGRAFLDALLTCPTAARRR